MAAGGLVLKPFFTLACSSLLEAVGYEHQYNFCLLTELLAQDNLSSYCDGSFLSCCSSCFYLLFLVELQRATVSPLLFLQHFVCSLFLCSCSHVVYIELNKEKLMLRSQSSRQSVYGPGIMQRHLGFKLAVLPVYLKKTCVSMHRTNIIRYVLIMKALVMHKNKR